MKLASIQPFLPVAGALVLALGVVGCASAGTVGNGDTAGSASSTSTNSATVDASPTASPADSATVVRVAYEDGKVDPEFDRVKIQAGRAVRIEVTSDVADEVHLHGYDLSSKVGPGKPASISFEADDSGVFEVELEDLGVPLVELAIR